MPVQLKATYVYIFTATVIFAVYGWWVFGILGVEYFTGPDALIRIGTALSALIIGGYAFEILTVIAVGVFNIKVLKKTSEDFILDERDNYILYKSIFASHNVLCVGICIAAITMALGLNVFWVFNLIVLAYLLSLVAELSTKLILYARGT